MLKPGRSEVFHRPRAAEAIRRSPLLDRVNRVRPAELGLGRVRPHLGGPRPTCAQLASDGPKLDLLRLGRPFLTSAWAGPGKPQLGRPPSPVARTGRVLSCLGVGRGPVTSAGITRPNRWKRFLRSPGPSYFFDRVASSTETTPAPVLRWAEMAGHRLHTSAWTESPVARALSIDQAAPTTEVTRLPRYIASISSPASSSVASSSTDNSAMVPEIPETESRRQGQGTWLQCH